jgi:putative intracellular protease/amidase
VDEENKKEFEYKLKNSLAPSQVNANDYNVIYYSGGFSCLVDYPESKEVAALATKIYESGGIVGAVCDGIAGLIPIKSTNDTFLVANKKITTNGYKKKNDLVSKTLIQHGAYITASKVVNENRIVTARGVRPRSVATEILRLLGLSIP